MTEENEKNEIEEDPVNLYIMRAVERGEPVHPR